MAEKRMFCQAIIESDAFTDMPAEAQMLYIHLSMAADDDGFCDKPRQVMRQCGASNDSMKLLISKKFVLTFDKNDGFIIVIKHWRMNNYIRKDTYHETKYKEFMKELYYDENQAYSMNPGDGHVPVIPGANTRSVLTPVTEPYLPRDESVTEPPRVRDEPLTQNRLDKNRLDKNSIEQISIEEEESEGKPERLAYWRERIEFFKSNGWDPMSMYSLAKNEGFSRAMIDGKD